MIKNSFLLLIGLILFASCDDNTDIYNKENPVLGLWNNYYENTDSLIITRVFTKDFYSYFSFAEGKKLDEFNKQEYNIVDDYILLESYTQKFRIDVDTLWITNSKQDQITKYIRDKDSPIILERNQMN